MAAYRGGLWCLERRFLKFSLSFYHKHCSYSTSSSDEPTKQSIPNDEMKIRDISRLPRHMKSLMEDRLAMPRIRFVYQTTDRYQRKYYGKLGRASGVDPSVCWPTKEELNNKIEEDSVFEPPLQETLEKLRKLREEEHIKFITRQKKIETNMASLGKWMAELQKRKDKKEAEINAAKAKKERLIEEVRQYFGYRLNPKDPKFQEALEKKEKEERKVAKEARKKDKFNKEMAKLAAMAQLENPQSKSTAESAQLKTDKQNDT